MQRNLVAITPRPDVAVDLPSIPRRVEHAGFRAGAMWIAATGVALQTGDARPRYRIRNWPEPLVVDGPVPEAAGRALEFRVLVDGEAVTLQPEPLPSGFR